MRYPPAVVLLCPFLSPLCHKPGKPFLGERRHPLTAREKEVDVVSQRQMHGDP